MHVKYIDEHTENCPILTKKNKNQMLEIKKINNIL